MSRIPLLHSKFGPAAAPSTLLNGLIASYSLDEASGVRNDSHTNALHLTDNNTVGQAAGLIGNSALFVPANLESLSRADEALLSIGAGNGLTICAFVWEVNRTVSSAVVSKFDAATGEYLLDIANGIPRFYVAASHVVVAAAAITTGAWHFLCARFDGTTQRLRVDAADVAPVAWTGSIPDGAANFKIGAADEGTRTMDGRIDLVHIWKRAGNGVLSDAEVSAVYNGGAGLAYGSF